MVRKCDLLVRSVERIVKKYTHMAKLPVDATVHTLRHSFATDLLTNGADLRIGSGDARTQEYRYDTDLHTRDK